MFWEEGGGHIWAISGNEDLNLVSGHFNSSAVYIVFTVHCICYIYACPSVVIEVFFV